MRRKRTWLRLFAAILVIVGGLLLYLRLFSGTTVQYAPSTDGKTVAYVRTYRSLSALDTDAVAVELRATHNPMRHIVFFGLNYGTALHIDWANPKELLVRCRECANLAVYGCDQRWKDVAIHYEFGDGSPTYPPTTFSGGAGPCIR